MGKTGRLRTEFPTQFRKPMCRRNKWQIFGAVPKQLWLCSFIGAIDNRNTVLEVQRFDRMDIDAELTSVQLRPGGNITEIGVSAAIHRVGACCSRQLLIIDVVGNKIIEEVECRHYIMG